MSSKLLQAEKWHSNSIQFTQQQISIYIDMTLQSESKNMLTKHVDKNALPLLELLALRRPKKYNEICNIYVHE